MKHQALRGLVAACRVDELYFVRSKTKLLHGCTKHCVVGRELHKCLVQKTDGMSRKRIAVVVWHRNEPSFDGIG